MGFALPLDLGCSTPLILTCSLFVHPTQFFSGSIPDRVCTSKAGSEQSLAVDTDRPFRALTPHSLIIQIPPQRPCHVGGPMQCVRSTSARHAATRSANHTSRRRCRLSVYTACDRNACSMCTSICILHITRHIFQTH